MIIRLIIGLLILIILIASKDSNHYNPPTIYPNKSEEIRDLESIINNLEKEKQKYENELDKRR